MRHLRLAVTVALLGVLGAPLVTAQITQPFVFGSGGGGAGGGVAAEDVTPGTFQDGLFTFSRAGDSTFEAGVTIANPTITSGTRWSPALTFKGSSDDFNQGVTRLSEMYILNKPVAATVPYGTLVFGGFNTETAADVELLTLNHQTGRATLGATGALFQAPLTGGYGFTSSGRIMQPDLGRFQFLGGDENSRGIEIYGGTDSPSLSSCGTGTVGAKSRAAAGFITATGATACTVNFQGGTWTNAPVCVVTLRNAPATAPYISAQFTSSFTVSGLTAGDVFNYFCVGLVGPT